MKKDNEVVEQAIVPIPMNVISSSHSSQKDALPEHDGAFVEVDAPVSYTHLDVYKRQLLYHKKQ